jgi:DNA helicase II / ATP-dependent DNA helicase PcrA
MSDPVLSSLNQIQRDIVTHCDGPALVLAGAGSGKTRAVTHKIAWLLREFQFMPYQILAVTFTNKAAGEMRERVRKLVGPPADGLELGTFHSVCARLLRRNADRLGYSSNFSIYDPDDAGVLMRQILKDLKYDIKKFTPRRMVSTLDTLRSHAVPFSTWISADGWEDSWRQEAVNVFDEFAKRKKALHAMDFSDLLHKMHELLQDHEEVRKQYQERFQYVLVDEMQDTNHVQLELLKLLVGQHQRICAVGDDDQSIYGWRGARVENMFEFETSFPGAQVFRLEQNYRSTQLILDAAHSVILRNRQRHAKKLWTEQKGGERIEVVAADTESDEAVQVARRIQRMIAQGQPAREIAIFFRTNAQSRSFEEIFSREKIPHIVVGGMRFYERAEIKDALAYLRVIANPRDEVSLLRIISRPPRGIGEVGIQRLRERAYDQGIGLANAGELLCNNDEPERWMNPFVAFFKKVLRWRQQAGQLLVSELVMEVLQESEYIEKLETLGTIEAQSRLENLEQLVASIAEQEHRVEELPLQVYLEQVALIMDIDSWAEDREHVPLMTVHAAKGLEFDHVFVTGLEEGLFPHRNHLDDDELDEERRLLYVAMTRARKRLVISHAKSRLRFGEWEYMQPSRFLMEISEQHLDKPEPRRRGSFSEAMAGRQQSAQRRPSVHVRRAGGTNWAGRKVRHSVHGPGTVLANVGDDIVVRFDSGKLVTVASGSVTVD